MKKQREKLTPRFTPYERNMIDSLVGKFAGSPSGVVSRIVASWLKDNIEYVKFMRMKND